MLNNYAIAVNLGAINILIVGLQLHHHHLLLRDHPTIFIIIIFLNSLQVPVVQASNRKLIQESKYQTLRHKIGPEIFRLIRPDRTKIRISDLLKSYHHTHFLFYLIILHNYSY